MEPKQQAVLFYQSLGVADEMSRKLLARGAQIQRGRAASLKQQLGDLEAKKASQDEMNKVSEELDKRVELAETYDKLDAIIGKALGQRAEMDEKKNFK